jgi:hypothetical protein
VHIHNQSLRNNIGLKIWLKTIEGKNVYMYEERKREVNLPTLSIWYRSRGCMFTLNSMPGESSLWSGAWGCISTVEV